MSDLDASALGFTVIYADIERGKNVVAEAHGKAVTRCGALTAIRALEGWSSGWAHVDYLVRADLMVTVLAYGLPWEGTDIPTTTMPMCQMHLDDASSKGLLVRTDALVPPRPVCWVCNPQYVVWDQGTVP